MWLDEAGQTSWNQVTYTCTCMHTLMLPFLKGRNGLQEASECPEKSQNLLFSEWVGGLRIACI